MPNSPAAPAATIDETAFQVLSYINSVRPLHGCAGTDEGAERGRRIVDQIAWQYQLQGNAADLTAEECVDVLRWIHWCEPVEGATLMGEPIDAETALVGLHVLLGTVEAALLMHLGLVPDDEDDDDQDVDDAA